MHYRDIADMNDDARQFAQDISRDVDLVVGIPRSGLLTANMVCLYLDVPMTDLEGLCERRVLETGDRFDKTFSLDTIDSVLIVDDSVNSGSQMTEVHDRVEDEEFPFDVQYGAIYISQSGHKYVDHWGEVVPTPRVFEWNMIHHPILKEACIDIDGVLCRDPTPEEKDDEDAYREFISEVDPKLVPNQSIHRLVTCRLEKYRPETEAWLDAHDVEYDSLVMRDTANKQARLEQGNHAGYKADVYTSTDTTLFIESDRHQAAEICRRTNKPVVCYDTMEMIRPERAGRAYQKSVGNISQLKQNPVSFPIKAGRHLVEKGYYWISR